MRRAIVEIRLPRRTGRLLLALAGATYTHLLIAVALLVWGTGVAGSRELPLLPTLAVRLAGPPPAPASEPPERAATPAPEPEPEPEPQAPPPRPEPEPEVQAVREVPETAPAPEPEEPPDAPEALPPAPASPTGPTREPGPAEVDAPGAASSAAGRTVGGLEGVAGVETYNQRVASILSTFIPWQRLVLPPGAPARVLTVSFLARRQGRRARVERVLIVAPSGYDAFDRAVERAVKEMAFVPLPAGEPASFLSFRFQVVLHPAGGP